MFIKLFFEFQNRYIGPPINHQRTGLKELVTQCHGRIHFPHEYLTHIQALSGLDEKLCTGNSIIHGDILAKNIILTPEEGLVLIDFEKVMRGTIEGEVASSILYSFMETGIDLEIVYYTLLSSVQKRVPIDIPNLRAAIAHKVAEYLLHKNIDHNSGRTKKEEIKKAGGFLLEALKIFSAND